MREMENPNVSGYSANSRLRRVDFPAPDGPEMTIGRYFWTVFLAWSVGLFEVGC